MVRRINGAEKYSTEQAVAKVVDDSTQPAEPVLTPPITKPSGVKGESGFFNPYKPDKSYNVVLRRLWEDGSGREYFRLDEAIGYWDASVGAVIVPGNLAQFRTDLTSVPRYFTWLIPTTGLHLPAALIHDGLVDDPPKPNEPPKPHTYIADDNIGRATADRILRDGMRDLGSSWVQRWLVWTAVATATIFKEPLKRTWWSRIAVAVTVLVILVAGTAATIDLFDCRELLPWMSDRTAWREVVYGAIAAVIVSGVLSMFWWPRWQAGVIAGIALALLLHVTVAVVIVFAVFNAIDSFIDRRMMRGLRSAALATVAIGGIVLIGMWTC